MISSLSSFGFFKFQYQFAMQVWLVLRHTDLNLFLTLNEVYPIICSVILIAYLSVSLSLEIAITVLIVILMFQQFPCSTQLALCRRLVH